MMIRQNTRPGHNINHGGSQLKENVFWGRTRLIKLSIGEEGGVKGRKGGRKEGIKEGKGRGVTINFDFLYNIFCNPISWTFDISNYEFW